MGNYITTAEIYALDNVSEQDIDSTSLDAVITFVEERIEKVCKQWFYLKEAHVRYYGGTLSKLLVLDFPLINLTSVEFKNASGQFVTQNINGFELFNQYPDDRYYPRLRINRYSEAYVSLSIRGTFPKGDRNIKLTGDWGYVAEDGTSVPSTIKQAAKLLVLDWINDPSTEEFEENIARQGITEESTDGHRYKKSSTNSAGNLTGNAIVDRLLKPYVRQIKVGVAQGVDQNYYYPSTRPGNY